MMRGTENRKFPFEKMASYGERYSELGSAVVTHLLHIEKIGCLIPAMDTTLRHCNESQTHVPFTFGVIFL